MEPSSRCRQSRVHADLAAETDVERVRRAAQVPELDRAGALMLMRVRMTPREFSRLASQSAIPTAVDW